MKTALRGYPLHLTDEDWRTIDFVGYRYCWSHALQEHAADIENHIVPEHVAWNLSEAFEADCEGGHSPFPMLDHRSELADKLVTFWNRIV